MDEELRKYVDDAIQKDEKLIFSVTEVEENVFELRRLALWDEGNREDVSVRLVSVEIGIGTDM